MVGNSIIKLLELNITIQRTEFLSWNLPHLPPFPSPLALASAISEPSNSDSQPKSKVPSAEHDDSSFYIILKNNDLWRCISNGKHSKYFQSPKELSKLLVILNCNTDLFFNLKPLLGGVWVTGKSTLP